MGFCWQIADCFISIFATPKFFVARTRRWNVLLHWVILTCATTSAAASTYTIATLGFDDLEHSRFGITGYKYSQPVQINELGQVSGFSFRYDDF